MYITDIMKDAVVIPEHATLTDVVTAMTTKHTNTVLVTDEEGILSGEVSVSDLFDAIIPPNLTGDEVLQYFSTEEQFKAAVQDAAELPVAEFMSADFSTVTADDTLITIAAEAINQQRARLPVVDSEDRPIGIISRRGLKQILSNFLHADR